MPNFERNPDEIGALWLKYLSDGRKMLSGSVTIDGKKTEIVCFEAQKRSENSPAFRILKSKPREQRPQDEEAF